MKKLLSLLVFAAALVEEVYQQSSETVSLADNQNDLPSNDWSWLDFQLLGKRIEKSFSMFCGDNGLSAQIISSEEDARKGRDCEEKESWYCESALQERTSQNWQCSSGETISREKMSRKIHSINSASVKSPTRRNEGDEKKIRKLYECISEEVQVNNLISSSQQRPSVLPLTQDKIVITWFSWKNPFSIRGRLFDSNLRSLGNEFQINSNSYLPGNADSSALLLPNDNYVVFWFTTKVELVFAIMNDDLVVKSEEVVNDPPSVNDTFLNVCSLADGRFLVIWQKNTSGDNHNLLGRIYDQFGNPQGNIFLIASTPVYMYSSSCSSSESGNFLVTWEGKNGYGNMKEVLAKLFDSNGTAIGSRISVNTYKNNIQERLSMATLNNGNFVIAWNSKSQDSSGNLGVYAQLFDPAGTHIGDEFQVNSYIQNDQWQPNVKALYDGGFLITWNSEYQDTSNWGVYGQRYDATASTVGNEFRINVETNSDQRYPDAATIYNGFIVAWESRDQDGSLYGIFARAYYDSMAHEDFLVCMNCLPNQYVDSDTCLDCRGECSTCRNGTDCDSCNDPEASPPLCCNLSSSISGESCSVLAVSHYFSEIGCEQCKADCGTCDSLGCLTCIISGIDCCSPSRVLQSDMITCDCPSECSTCDSEGCLSCSSGQSCCSSARFFDSDSNTCKDCETKDDKGCLSCPYGVLMCCPDGRFFDLMTETCEECTSPCKTCNSSTECTSCDPGSTCCGEGRYLDSQDETCKDCLSDCATCSNGSSCDICTDPDFEGPECCPDTQQDANKDGFCECLDGTTAISNCVCQANQQWVWDGTAYSCSAIDASSPLTIQGFSKIGSSCSEDLELIVTDFSDLESSDFNSIKFRWFSDSSSLAEYLRGQVSNLLSIPSDDLPSGTTTFTVYMSVYGVVFSGTHSVNKTDDVDLTLSLSHETLTILSSVDSTEVKVTVSSQPCPSIAYSWSAVSSSQTFQLPESSSETLLIPSNTLPIDTPTLYTFSASSGSSLFTQSLVFYVKSSDLVAVIDPVGPYVSSLEDLILNGKNSFDTSEDSESLRFFWVCAEVECGSCPSLPAITKSRLRISSIELSPGMSFTIILTVYKGDKSSSVSVRLSVV